MEKRKSEATVFALAGVFILAILTQVMTFLLITDGQLNDDAAYVLRAMKLAFPDGYPQLRPDPTNFPIGWPLLLAPFFWITDDFYLVGRLLAVVLTGLTAMALYSLFRNRNQTVWFAVGGVVLFLHSPQILMLGSSLMSEPFCFFLIVISLYFVPRAQSWWHFVLLGLVGAWCISTRMECVTVVFAAAVALWRIHGLARPLFLYLGAFVGGFATSYVLLTDANKESHAGSVSGVFVGKSFEELLGYPAIFMTSNSRLIVESTFGKLPTVAVVLILILPAAVLYTFKNVGWKKTLLEGTRDPAVIWVFVHPAVLFFWPFFQARYWTLWTVLSLALAVGAFPKKARMGLMVTLLILQIPGAFNKYSKAPTARQFQNQIYLPYYRELSRAERVMTLKSCRLATLAFVATTEPLTRTDFQSIPIGMAYMDCPVIEWDTKPRNVRAYDGSEARPFPPNTLEGLRNSTLFEPFVSCAFSESYRLVADPEALKVAGRLYSQAMQTQDLSAREKFLAQALEQVADLPEARLVYAQTLMKTDPESPKGKALLEELFEQYPSMRETAGRS